MTPIRTDGLTKEFRLGLGRQRVVALDRLNLEVHQGEIFGFLGHNGAGKTTTIKLLLGLLAPTAGQAWRLEWPIEDVTIKQQVGFLPEAPYFYEYLTAEEFLTFYGQLFGLGGAPLTKKVEELLEMVALTDARRLQLRKFSKGMLQRVGVAQALINDPELVVLDEPMSGLDPIGRKEVRDLILRLKESGKTVMFSSHILHDAEVLCDRVAMILKGRLVACGRVTDLLDQGASHQVELIVDRLTPEGLDHLRPLTDKVVMQGDRMLVVLKNQQQVGGALEIIRSAKACLVSLNPQKGSLEDLFIREVKGHRSP